MKHYCKLAFIGILTMMVSSTFGSVESVAAEDDGKSIRAYLSLPFGASAPQAEDVQLGLQMIQEFREADSGPMVKLGATTVVDFAFNSDGLAVGEIMGYNMLETYQLINEPGTRGQLQLTNGEIIALAFGGAAIGTAFLCLTDAICDSSKQPSKPKCIAFNDNQALGVICDD